MQTRKFASSAGKVASLMFVSGTVTAGPGYEQTSFPFAPITAVESGEISNDSNIVSDSSFLMTTAAFCARIIYTRTSANWLSIAL
ncbi:uncharacterized protein EDB91DRAFT_1107019, partial [Suillus paluster]|uniref:uncharacterized protein n=1 Tax=Suillus paluster TaxID=48578 RepID=UPI001B860F37